MTQDKQAVRKVLFDDPDIWRGEGPRMKFRLTYEGPLPATQRHHKEPSDELKRAPVKHNIRQHFHRQLARLWTVNKNLAAPAAYKQTFTLEGDAPPTPAQLAEKFALYGWNFVPLVTDGMSLLCGLEVLLLRPTPKEKDSWFGDVDNRLKTLVDCLGMPSVNERYVDHPPGEGEAPFFCLMENDRLLTKLALETDEMLAPVGTEMVESDVRLIIEVEVRPLIVSMRNLHFAG